MMAPDFYDSQVCKEAQQAFFEKRKPNLLTTANKATVMGVELS